MTNIEQTIVKQREFFRTGKTLDIKFRLAQLKKLRVALVQNEQAFYQSMMDDFGKCEFEVYATEIAFIISGIKEYERKLWRWTRTKTVPKSVASLHAKSTIRLEPFGVMLIISPWNYPLFLTLLPLIGAIAAGNTAVVKPSRYVPKTAGLMKKIINDNFSDEYIAVFEGGRQVNEELLAQRYDYMFFTGGTVVGKIVMKAAAENLTPVTLELGGKSPCIVDETADIKKAAKAIMWGKLINAGQTCIAPDYVMVQAQVKQKLIREMKNYVRAFYGKDPKFSKDFARIVTDKHFERICALIDKGKVSFGGEIDAKSRYIAPTVMDNAEFDDAAMQEEIFGPVLPVIEYDDEAEMMQKLQKRETPLALYIFSRDKKKVKNYIETLPSGDVVVNDTLLQIVNSHLPFGGKGSSGMGHYHGKHSINAFSHHRSVVYRNRLLDIPRYAPYEKILWLIKKLL